MHGEWQRKSYCATDFSIVFEQRPPALIGPHKVCHTDEMEISAVESGPSLICNNSRTEIVESGHATVIAPGVEHSSWTGENAVRECNMHISWSAVKQAADELGLQTRFVVPSHPFPIPIEVKYLMQGLRAATEQKNVGDQLVVESMVTALLAVLLKQFFSRRYRPPSGRDSIHAKVKQAESLLRECYDQPVSIDQLARAANLSRFHFMRSFKKYFGVPPHAYQTMLRLERARELMGSHYTLTDIAFAVGFGSSSRFTQAFAREFGVTPSIWRKQNKIRSGARSR